MERSDKNAELLDDQLESVSGGSNDKSLPKEGSPEYIRSWANGCPNCGSKRIVYIRSGGTSGYNCEDCCYAEGHGQIIKIQL